MPLVSILGRLCVGPVAQLSSLLVSNLLDAGDEVPDGGKFAGAIPTNPFFLPMDFRQQ